MAFPLKVEGPHEPLKTTGRFLWEGGSNRRKSGDRSSAHTPPAFMFRGERRSFRCMFPQS